MRPEVFLAVLPILASLPRSHHEPSIRNAQIHRLGASGHLERDLTVLGSRIGETAWVGYAVAMVEGNRRICCGDGGCCGVCRLETENRCLEMDDELGRTSRVLVVMYRIHSRQIEKVRVFTDDCELDASGLPVYWWSDVDPEQSLAFLDRILERPPSARTGESAIQAVALHDHRRAGGILERLASEGSADVSEKAVFWLGASRGEEGVSVLKRVVRRAHADLREQIAFALHVSQAPEALPQLVDMARKDPSPDVRERALFWLGQEAGKKAARTIAGAIEDDPEIEVKEQAVFALSRLPPDEGIPLLIDVARSHRHPEVRRKALFWLGQSGDPRALALFEEILLKSPR